MDFRSIIHKLRALNYSMLDQAVVSGSNFVSALLIVRLVGIYDFGIFSTYWIALLFVNTLFVSTIVSPMMLFVSKEKSLNNYYGSLLTFVISFTILFFGISIMFSSLYNKYFLNESNVQVIVIFSLYVAVYHLQDYFRRYFYSLRYYKKALIIDMFSHITRILIFSYLVFQKGLETNLPIVFLIYVLTTLIGVSYGIVNYSCEFDKNQIKGHFIHHYKMAKWLVPSGIMKWSSVNLFLASSSFILGPVSLGVIRLSQNIVSVYNLILLGIENFVPLEAGSVFYDRGYSGLFKYLKNILIAGILFTILVSSILIILADHIISFIYGEEYQEFSYILYWFAVFIVFMFINSIMNIYLITVNQTKTTFLSYLCTSIFALSFFYPLIKKYDITGVMLGMLLTYIALTVITIVLTKKNDNEGEKRQ